MKYIITTCVITFSTLLCQAQIERKKENFNPIPQRSIEVNNSNSTNKVDLKDDLKKEISAPNRQILSSDDSSKSLATPKKATRMNEVVAKNDIKIDIDQKKSDLDNLLILIEEKENIHKHNASLVQNSKYDDLLSEIAKYKTSFNNSVSKKGIENCTTKEQNFFLAFLKEDGKEAEYKTAIAKLK